MLNNLRPRLKHRDQPASPQTGAKAPGRPSSIRPEDYPELLRLRARGRSFIELASRYDCTADTVSLHFRRAQNKHHSEK